ncbi:uncharacterized protein LOC110449501 isoform X2 [Mizuhopecten yessoensis]|uniref:uncharacterized protein LOC110449501 isoform X2 n=1 Tax=Mizuhopecten yessoensis TaxID=6573 RepID=UPI000B45E586|nr:uncharacterized protein LOC110449501 isoform X2 [Mizuhopecten yessoensis]
MCTYACLIHGGQIPACGIALQRKEGRQTLTHRLPVSAIRSILHSAERGNAQGLDSTAVSRALEEYRQLASLLQNQEHDHHNSKESSHYESHQDQETLSRYGNSKRQREIPKVASTSEHKGHYPTESSTYRGKHEQDRNKADMEREIQELRTRLSSVVGAKLTAGNTSLADLSDPNRPTSIAEQHRELYNDVWANALEELTLKDRNTEKKAVLELGNILKKTYEITKQLSKESAKSMVEAIMASLHNIGVPQSTQLSGHAADSAGTLLAHVHAIRRENVEMSIPQIKQECCKEMKTLDKRSQPCVYQYATQCARLTWLMNIQDPPLVLKWAKEGEPFQSQYFSEYTSRGTTVDFTAWPALLIQENGAILAKGIAQPKRK